MTWARRFAAVVVLLASVAVACDKSNIDWTDAVDEGWSGTITVNEHSEWSGTEISSCCEETTSMISNTSATVQKVQDSVSITAQQDSTLTKVFSQNYDWHGVDGTTKETRSLWGEGNTGNKVTVNLASDGTYEIAVDAGVITNGEWHKSQEGTVWCKGAQPVPCGSASQPVNIQDSAPANDSYGISKILEGTLDPQHPNALSDSITEDVLGDDGRTTTFTIAWELTRN